MDNLPERLRQHYAAQSLSPEAVNRILRAGEIGRQRRRRFRWYGGAIAAILLAACSLYLSPHYATRVEIAEIETSVESFFAQPDFHLDRLSADPEVLRTWLIGQGAPAQAVLPPGLIGSPAVGCKVLRVGRRDAFMICFAVQLDSPKMNRDSAQRIKPATQTDASSAKSASTLVHLIIVPTSSLRHSLGLKEHPRTESRGQWNFSVWEHSDTSYILASTASPERLHRLLQQS
jgi:hypothetical protein